MFFFVTGGSVGAVRARPRVIVRGCLAGDRARHHLIAFSLASGSGLSMYTSYQFCARTDPYLILARTSLRIGSPSRTRSRARVVTDGSRGLVVDPYAQGAFRFGSFTSTRTEG